MYAAERQSLLLRRSRSEGRLDVTTMAAELDVTPETIRRDLGALERQGLLRRVHGGAIPAERLDVEPELAARDTVSSAEKELIAKAALDQVHGAATLLVDGGTTTARFAQLLPADRELTVLTNSLPIASLLATRANTTVSLVGGRVRSRTLATVDTWALDALDGLTVDVALVGANGFSADRGFTTPDAAEAAVKAAMVGAARRTVVLADSSKHRADALVRFARTSDVDVLVTDPGLPARHRAALEAAGPEVVVA
ncbi:DeoR/GlpR family DNA-binding transcription regulator [Rhodococcus aerolatus]